MALRNLIPCPNSFPKQVVAYLLFLLLPCKWKGWCWERMSSERPMLGFFALDVKRGQMDQCPVSGNVFPCFVVAPTTISVWMEPSVVAEHVEHPQKSKSGSSECPRLEQPLSTFSRKRQAGRSAVVPHTKGHSAAPNNLYTLKKEKPCMS